VCIQNWILKEVGAGFSGEWGKVTNVNTGGICVHTELDSQGFGGGILEGMGRVTNVNTEGICVQHCVHTELDSQGIGGWILEGIGEGY